MKRNRLITEFAYDFELLGIVSSSKEYTLAWYFNQLDELHFVKQEDIDIEFKDMSRILISNYVSSSEQAQLTLLRNKLIQTNSSKNQFLLAEAQQFDYLLKIETRVDDFGSDDLVSLIRSITVVDYLAKLNLDKLKQKENLLY